MSQDYGLGVAGFSRSEYLIHPRCTSAEWLVTNRAAGWLPPDTAAAAPPAGENPSVGSSTPAPSKQATQSESYGQTSSSCTSAYRPATAQESHSIPGGGGPTFDSGFDPSHLDTRYTYKPPQHLVFGLNRPQTQSPFPSSASHRLALHPTPMTAYYLTPLQATRDVRLMITTSVAGRV